MSCWQGIWERWVLLTTGWGCVRYIQAHGNSNGGLGLQPVAVLRHPLLGQDLGYRTGQVHRRKYMANQTTCPADACP